MGDPPWLQTIWNVLLLPDQDFLTSGIRKLLMNYTLCYSTILINDTYLFCCMWSVFLFLLFRKSKCIKWWKCTTFSFIFTSNVKTFKIDNSHTNRIEGRIEMPLFIICYKFQSRMQRNRVFKRHLLKNATDFFFQPDILA